MMKLKALNLNVNMDKARVHKSMLRNRQVSADVSNKCYRFFFFKKKRETYDGTLKSLKLSHT